MISVVMCTYNRAKSLSKTLDSVARLEVPSVVQWELVIVDNNSTDGTSEIVRRFAEAQSFRIKYVFEPIQGLSHARNAGVSAAAGDVIAFSDDDVLFDKFWLVNLSGIFEDANCIAGGGKVVPIWSTPPPSWFQDQPDLTFNGLIVKFDLGDEQRPIREPAFGANMAFRRRAFDQYGLFRTDLGRNGNSLISGEETELFYRLIRAGELVMYAPDAVVYHPVPTERLTPAYARRLFFATGKMIVRTEGVHENCIRYFRIPRYLIRRFGERLTMRMMSVRKDTRLVKSMQMYLVCGMIAECWNRGQPQKVSLDGNESGVN